MAERANATGRAIGLALALICPLAAGATDLAPPAASTGAAAKPAAVVPAENFFRHPSVLRAELSPTGRHVAITAVRDDSRASLLVVDLQQTAEPARVLASYKKLDVVDFHWVNDERLLYSLGQLEPGKIRGHAPGLFSVDVGGKQHVELICSEVKSCRQQPGTLDLSHHLLFVPVPQAGVKPNEVVLGQARGGQYHVAPMWLDTRSGIVRRMDMPAAPDGAAAWWFDPRGEPRLAMSVDEGRASYHWLAPGATSWRRIAEFDVLQEPFRPVAVAGDGRLYVTHQRGEAREAVLTTFDFDTLAPATRPIVQVPGFDFEGMLVPGEPGAGMVGLHLDADAGVSVWFDEAMKRFQEAVDKRLPGRVNLIQCRRCGQADMVALVQSYADRDPGRLLLYRAATQRWENVAVVLDGIDPRKMAGVDFQRIKARDGRDLPVWLTLPQGVPAGQAAPAVVLVHGGPWMRGGSWRWAPMEQFLASRGYLVIAPDFRGSTGYGEAHWRAGFKQWGQAMQDDVADALLWARKQGLASDRACIAGASYGGYATLMGLVRHPDLYRCGVAWVAVADPFLFLEGSSWVLDDIGRWGRRHMLPEMVGDVDKDAAMLTAVSPVAQAERIRAPLLLAYGEDDLRVPLTHGTRLREALIKAGHPPEWIVYPNEGHGWQHLSTRVDFAQRVEAFLQRHLRDPAQ